MRRKEKFVRPIDDWYPNREDGTVKVSLHKDKKASWRVAVWGADDFGLEKGNLTIDEAFSEFNLISDGIGKESLKKRGFDPA